jgi:hypothetical protein
LSKFKEEEAIVLAVIDKAKMSVSKIFFTDPNKVVTRLEEKLEEKRLRFMNKGSQVRRLQVSLSLRDLEMVGARQTYP